MPRSGREARARLQQAALDLYGEQGFDRTTTAELATRAGVTERTYFRHFADKREVLFDGEPLVRDLLVAGVDDAPTHLPTLEVLRTACLSLEGLLEETRDVTAHRHRVIAATPALRERELAKLDSLADAVAAALVRRGVSDRRAALAARAGIAAFDLAVVAWYADASLGVRSHLDAAFDDLSSLG